MLTEKDLDLIERHLKDVFATKEEMTQIKSDLMTKLDKILKNTETTKTKIIILTHQVKGHTDRLEKLERIHPEGKHLHLSA